MPSDDLPDWEAVLSAAARLQRILPDATLVGGTAAAMHAHHRASRDADHTLRDLKDRFEQVLGTLESVAGWKTARLQRPVLILGSLDGIETGIRQLRRAHPLETTTIEHQGQLITVPTMAEILRIKAFLTLVRNATRDYLDLVALADALGPTRALDALASLDALYPQENGESPLMQLIIQLANPMPYDLEGTDLREYKDLDLKWQNWSRVQLDCAALADQLFEHAAKSWQGPNRL